LKRTNPAPLLASVVCFDGALNWKRFLFWMMVCLAPLAEVLTKGGLPYHFSSALPGIAVFIAFSLRFGCKGYKIILQFFCYVPLFPLFWVFDSSA